MIRAAHATAAGWADQRLADAYDLIWAAQQDHKAAGIGGLFNKLLSAVEGVDDHLSAAVADMADEAAAVRLQQASDIIRAEKVRAS